MFDDVAPVRVIVLLRVGATESMGIVGKLMSNSLPYHTFGNFRVLQERINVNL